MTETWQTIEQAAVTLRLSVRTINRHIASGKLQSRLNDGRREVLVTAAPTDAQTSTDTPATSAAQPSVDAETVLTLADSAAEKAELAVAAYQALARVSDTQLRHVRRSARFAWAAVAVMAVGVTIAVGWTTHKLTRTFAQVEQLQSSLTSANDASRQLSDKHDAAIADRIAIDRQLRTELSDRARAMQSERAAAEQSLRAELAAAHEQAARAEGALTAYKELADMSDGDSAVLARLSTPTTMPSASPRKVDAPQTRPAAASDTSSASTAEED